MTHPVLRLSRPAALCLLLAGCGSDRPLTLVDSDVPVPPEMDVRYAFDIARNGGELSAGRFILSGTVMDVAAAADDTVARYGENGWTLSSRTMQESAATLVFTKGARTSTVEIARRRIDPEMSSAVIVVSRTG